MPAKDTYHNVMKNALIKDGWAVTNDPFRLKWGAISVISYQLSVISTSY